MLGDRPRCARPHRALVEDSIIFDNCDIGRHAKVRRAILDKNVKVPEGAEIGYDLDEDRKKYFVTDSGLWLWKAIIRPSISRPSRCNSDSVTRHSEPAA